jgi:hypothetical protein
VSRDTIIRDSKISEAIDAIGETSPEAKRLILSGDVVMKKKDLNALSNMVKEEIESIAAQIEEGAYNKKNAPTAAPKVPLAPLDAAIAGVQPLTAAIGKVSSVFQKTLPDITRKAEKAKLQGALRQCIDMLEEIYSRI